MFDYPVTLTPDGDTVLVTFAAEHLRHAAPAADHGLQVEVGQPLLLHVELDGLNRVRRQHRKVLGLIGHDQPNQRLKVRAFVAMGIGVGVRVRLHQLDRRLVIGPRGRCQ